MSKNIVEKYIESNGQLIILISGLSGSGKTKLGDKISRDFKIAKLDIQRKYKPNYNDTVKLPNGVNVINYDTDASMDWDNINTEINNMKKTGVVVIGKAFPTDKLNFKADYHIHLKITKSDLKTKRFDNLNKMPSDIFDPDTERLYLNILTYPYYLDVFNRMKKDLVIFASPLSEDEIYDSVFDALIQFIKENIYDMRIPSQNALKQSNPTKNILSDSGISSSSEADNDDIDYIFTYREHDV